MLAPTEAPEMDLKAVSGGGKEVLGRIAVSEEKRRESEGEMKRAD